MGDPRFKGIEYKVGLFIIVALILVISTVVLYAVQKEVFTKKVQIIIYAKSGEGLKKGMPVIYSGFQIARVSSVVLEDANKVKITAEIPLKYTKWIKKDSTVKIIAQNLIGSQSLYFSGGSAESPPVEKDTVFTLIRDKGVDDIIEKARPVMDDLKVIVKNLRVLSDKLADDNGNVSKTLKMLGIVSQEITEKKSSLGILLRTNYLTDKLDGIFANINRMQNEIDKILKQTEGIADNINNGITETRSSINLISDNLKLSKKAIGTLQLQIESLEPILKDVKKISNNLANTTDNLSSMRNDLELMIDMGAGLMIKLDNMWPFAEKKENFELKMP
jgi:phospholipid/cholesterol/gamma-HCH transport system substrate-binding protein